MSSESKKVQAHYEGTVLTIEESSFFARLYLLHSSRDEELEVEFPFSSINEDRKEIADFFKPGGIFDFKIFDDSSTELIFRKDRWTKEEVEKIKAEAAEMYEFFRNKNIK